MSSSNEEFNHFDSSHSERILSALYKQWIDGKFLDVTIKVGNECITAHRCVLIAVSQYFEALFGSDMSNSNLEVVSLHDVDADAVRLLINFAYVGSVEITVGNAEDLLIASSYLCIDSVVKACCRFLLQNISVENCIDIHELAVRFGQLKMRQGAENFMISHFGQLLQEGHFLKMDIETFTVLLENDELIVMENKFSPLSQAEQETKLVEAVLRYVNEDPVMRMKHLMSLLSCGIRLLLLTRETIESLKISELIVSSPECQNLLNQILLSEISDYESECWKRQRYFPVEYTSTQMIANSHAIHLEVMPREFDDRILFREDDCVFIVGMNLHTRLWKGHQVIAGLKILYNSGLSMHHGFKSSVDSDIAEFRLGPNERITAINTQTGYMVHQLEFKSDTGKTFGPYGDERGRKRSFLRPHEGGYLAFITGDIDRIEGAEYIRNINFIWAFPKSLKGRGDDNGYDYNDDDRNYNDDADFVHDDFHCYDVDDRWL